MKKRFLVAPAACLTMLALVACAAPSDMTSSPLGSLPTAAPRPSPSPASTAGPDDAARRITGSVTLNAGVPGGSLIVGLNQLEGFAWKKIDSATRSADAAGSFAFEGLAAGSYQTVWENQATDLVDAAVDPLGLYVSEGLVVPETGEATMSVDLGWAFSPNLGPNAVYVQGESISFTPNAHVPDAEYQLVVADANKQLIWSSAWGSETSFRWSGKSGTETNSPNGPTLADFSQCTYTIKFRKAGSTFGGNGPYGQTKWVRFGFKRMQLEV